MTNLNVTAETFNDILWLDGKVWQGRDLASVGVESAIKPLVKACMGWGTDTVVQAVACILTGEVGQ